MCKNQKFESKQFVTVEIYLSAHYFRIICNKNKLVILPIHNITYKTQIINMN